MMFPSVRTLGLMLAATTFVWSCGDVGQSPISSVEPAGEIHEIPSAIQEGPAGTIVFTHRGLMAAKWAGDKRTKVSKKESKWIKTKDGGDIKVEIKDDDYKHAEEDAGYRDDADADYDDANIVRVKSAKFKIHKKSMKGVFPSREDVHLVEMTVLSGTTLDDAAIQFWPSGMEFSPGAELEIKFEGTFEGEDLVGYHQDRDGRVSKITVTVKKKKDEFTIKMIIPGFSEYSWDDGDDDSDEDPTEIDGSCWGC